MHTAKKPILVLLLMILMGVGQIVAPPGGALAAKNTLLQQLSNEIADIAEKAQPAVVQIISTSTKTERVDPFDFFNRRRSFERQIPQRGLGSGFFFSSDGYILTNNHVVADSDEIMVYMNDGSRKKAKVIGSDAQSEVAVIKVEGKNFPYLELGDSDSLRVGNLVFTVGSPQGLEQSVTMGIVSALNRANIEIIDDDADADFIQTDAAINPGNSGGPLLDIHGKVVGINTAIFSTSGGSQGMGFTIPINKARAIANKIKKYGKVERGFLGIFMNDLTPKSADYLGTDGRMGAVVSEVIEESPADGNLLAHDAIVAVDGKPLKNSSALKNRISDLVPGETVALTVVREGKDVKVRVKLGVRPGEKEIASVQEEKKFPVKEKAESFGLGFSVRKLTPDDKDRLGFEDPTGLLVTDVEESSEAYYEGLRPDMMIVEVNRMEVYSLDDLRKALKIERRRQTVMLRVRTAQGNRLLFLSR